MKLVTIASLVGATLAATVIAAANPDAEKYWPQWRGPHATGVAVNGNPPVEWSESKNIRWKVEIPGRGSSSPVVWGDRLFVLTAVPAGVDTAASHTPRGSIQPRVPHRFLVLAIDRRTGKTVWERTANEAIPHEPSHPDNGTWARLRQSPTASTSSHRSTRSATTRTT
jgi:outer membrane protein assembly factor BamB